MLIHFCAFSFVYCLMDYPLRWVVVVVPWGDPRIPSYSESGDAGQHFCHDLVVPQFCECMLIVPIRTLNVDESFDVSDTNGNVVLKILQR